MAAVLANTLRGYRLAILMVGAGVFFVSVLLTYAFDSFGGVQSAQQLDQFIPESIKALLKAQGGFATNVMGFIASTYRHPLYILAVSGFVIGVSSGAVAREVERGSILLVLASPIPRWRYLIARTLAMAIGLFAVLAAAFLGTWLATRVTGLSADVDMTGFLRIQANAFALGLAVGGVATLVSSVGSDGGRTVGIVTAITAGMFFADYLATLWEPARALGPLSFFHYFDPLAVAQQGAMPWRNLAVLLGSAAVTLGAALVAFQRRDIAR